MNKPLVSICIPTFNRDQYLTQAIESALNQDYQNIEVIVADNCSSDGTQELVKKFRNDIRFSYYRNETNVGMVNNWKVLLDDRVSGEWFLLLSDDDYLIDLSYISEAMSIASQEPKVNMIYANGYVEHTAKKRRQKLNLPYNNIEDGQKIFMTSHNVKPQAYTLCNILFNTEISKQLLAFSNPDNLCCDSELFLKMCLTGKVGVVNKCVSAYRVHTSNLITQKRTFKELMAMASDSYIAPQVMAKEMKVISETDLAKREREFVVPELKKILVCVYSVDTNLVGGFISMLKNEGVNASAFYRDPIFLFKTFIARNSYIYWKFRKLKQFVRDMQ